MGGEHDEVGQLGGGDLGLDDQQVHDLSDPGHGLGLTEVTLRQFHPKDDQGPRVSRAGGASGSDCSAEVRSGEIGKWSVFRIEINYAKAWIE